MMKNTLLLPAILFSLTLFSQDSANRASGPVELFTSERAINANTPGTIGKGRMAFRVAHNFGDIAGKNGGIEKFWGLDATSDIRIGVDIGVGEKLDLVVGRSKGGSIVQQLWEFGVKYQLLQQLQDGSGSPVALTFYTNMVISSQPENPLLNMENSFRDFGDRVSNLFQLILARKFGGVTIAVLPTYLTRGYAVSYDEKNYFALGGALRVPVITGRMNVLVDYFHTFRNDEVKRAYYENVQRRFYDPLGIGFEYITSGHVFRMNFTNSTDILPNRFIPHTFTSWSKGQYRWGFTISRYFRLWR
jgi:hypothetical protein